MDAENANGHQMAVFYISEYYGWKIAAIIRLSVNKRPFNLLPGPGIFA